jgi:hypothetical protein
MAVEPFAHSRKGIGELGSGHANLHDPYSEPHGKVLIGESLTPIHNPSPPIASPCEARFAL